MAKSKRAQIKQDLLDQLKRNGTEGNHYTDLVEDYMSLYDTKVGLIRDIKKRGQKVTVTTANGTENIKTNDSVIDFLKVDAQMLKILEFLGLQPSKEEGETEDDEPDQL